MEAIINQVAAVFARASTEAHSHILCASVELARVEDENERLRASLKLAMQSASNEYLMSDEAGEIGDLIGFDPLAAMTSRFEQATL